MLNQVYGCVLVIAAAGLYNVTQFTLSLLPYWPETVRHHGKAINAGNDAVYGGSETLKQEISSQAISRRIHDYLYGNLKNGEAERKQSSSEEQKKKENFWSYVPGFFLAEDVVAGSQKIAKPKQMNGGDGGEAWSTVVYDKLMDWTRVVVRDSGAEAPAQKEAKSKHLADDIEDSISIICANADALVSFFCDAISGLLCNLVGNLLYIRDRICENVLLYFLLSVVTPVMAAIVTVHEMEKRKKEKKRRGADRLETMDGIFHDYLAAESRRNASHQFFPEKEAETAEKEIEDGQSQTDDASKAFKLKPKSSSAAILASVIGRLRLGRFRKSNESDILSKSESDVRESEPMIQESEPMIQESDPMIQESESMIQESDILQIEKGELEFKSLEEEEENDFEDGNPSMDEWREVEIETEELEKKVGEGEVGIGEKMSRDEIGKEEEEEVEEQVVREGEAAEEGIELTSNSTEESVDISENTSTTTKMLTELEENKMFIQMRELTKEPETSKEHGAHIGPMGDTLEASFPEEIINLAVITSANCWKGGIETLV